MGALQARCVAIAIIVVLLAPAHAATPGNQGPTSAQETYLTVQEAVDAAPAGAVIVLHASNVTSDPTPWREHVVIPEAKAGLTLCGAAGSSAQDPGPIVVHTVRTAAEVCDPRHSDEVVIDASGVAGTVLDIRAANVTVTGLTLRWSIEAWDLWADPIRHAESIAHRVDAVRADAPGLTFTDNHVVVKAGPCAGGPCAPPLPATGMTLTGNASAASVQDNRFTATSPGGNGGWLGGAVAIQGTLNDSAIDRNTFTGWHSASVRINLDPDAAPSSLRHNQVRLGGPFVVESGHGWLDAAGNDLARAVPVALDLGSATHDLYVDAANTTWGTDTCDLIHGNDALPGRITDAGTDNVVGINPFIVRPPLATLPGGLATSCPIERLEIDAGVRDIDHDADDRRNRTFTATAFDAWNGVVPIDSHDDVTWSIETGGGTFTGNVLEPGNTTGTYGIDAVLRDDNTISDRTDFRVHPGQPIRLEPEHVTTLAPSADDARVNVTYGVRDAHGNTVPDANVSFDWNGTAWATLGPATNHGNGSYTVTLTTTNMSGARYHVTVDLRGTDGAPIDQDMTDSIVVQPGHPVALQLVRTGDPTPSADTPNVTLDFRLDDAHGNGVPDANVTTRLSGPAGGVLADTTDHGNGTYATRLTTTRHAGDTFVVTADVHDTDGTLIDSAASAPIEVVPGAPHRITVASVDTYTPHADAPETLVLFHVFDAHDNPVPDAPVHVIRTGPGGTLGPLTDLGNGSYAVHLTTTRTSGDTFTVVGTLLAADGTTLDVAITEPIIVGHGAPVTLSLDDIETLTPSADDARVTATFRITDNASNPVTDADLAVTLEGPSGGALGPVAALPGGRYTVDLVTTRNAGDTFRLFAEVRDNGTTVHKIATPPIRVVPGTPVALLVHDVSTTAPSADDPYVTAVFQARDAHGNPVAGAPVDATHTGPDGGTLGPLADIGDGTYTLRLDTTRIAGDIFGITATLRDDQGNALIDAATPPFTVQPGRPASLTVVSPTSDQIVPPEQPHQNVTFRVSDAHGNAAPGATLEVTVNHPEGILGAVTDHDDGTYRVQLTTTESAGDTFTVTARLVVDQTTVAVAEAPSIRVQGRALRFVDIPSEIASGTPFALTVDILDELDQRVTNATDRVFVELRSHPTGATLRGVAALDAASGRATFTGLTLDRVGLYTLSATAPDLDRTTTAQVRVAAGAPTQMAFDGLPSRTTPREPFDVRLRLLDTNGNLATGTATQVTLSVFHGASTLHATGSAQGGIVTLPGVHLDAAGTHNLRATAPGVTAATSPTIDVRSPPPASLRILPPGAAPTMTSDTPLVLGVEIVDENGNRATDATAAITVTKAAGPGAGNIRGERTLTAVDGLATFTLHLDHVGTYILRYQSTGLGDTTTGAIEVTPGAPTQIQFTGTPHHVPIDQPFGLSLAVRDANGNRLAGLDAAHTLDLEVQSDAPGPLRGTTTMSAPAGQATVTDLTLQATGTYRLSATLRAPDGTPLLRQTGPAVEAGPGAPAALVLAGLPERTASGTTFTATVRVLDTAGNVVPDATQPITLARATGPPGGNLRGPLTATTVDGVATFPDLTFDRTGRYSIIATTPGLRTQSTSIDVSAGAADHLVFGATTTPDPAFATTVRVEDAHGNRVPTSARPITIAIDAGPSGARLHGTTAATTDNGIAVFEGLRTSAPGTYRLVASTPGLAVAVSPPIRVNPPGADDVAHLRLAPDTDLTVQAGTTHRFALHATDVHGIPVEGSLAATYRLSNPRIGSITPDGTFHAIHTGAVELRAQLGNILSDPVTIIVAPGDLARLRITPEATAASPSTPIAFIAEGMDAYGNAVPVAEVAWSIDGVAQGNLSGTQPLQFTARDTSGVHRIHALSEGRQGNATATVTATEVAAGQAAVLNATRTETRLRNATTVMHSAAVASASAGSRLNLTAGTGNRTGLASFDAQIERDAHQLSLNVEAHSGGLDAPPEGIDLADLSAHLEELATAPTPAQFIRVAASEGGQEVGSTRLNEILGTVNATFWLPRAYFDDNDLDPERVHLIEYSGSERQPEPIPAVRTTNRTDADAIGYRVMLDAFSTFAVVATQAVAVETRVGGGGGGGGPVAKTLYESLLPDDPVFQGASLRLDQAAFLRGWRVDTFAADAAPVDTPPLADGLDVLRYARVHTGAPDGTVANVTFRLSIDHATPDAHQRTHIVRLGPDGWTHATRLNLAADGDRLTGTATTACCGLYAVVVDRAPPTLRLDLPSGPLVGTVPIAVEATDNLHVVAVTMRLGNGTPVVLPQAPYLTRWDTTAHPDGTHTVVVTVEDASGWTTTTTRHVVVQNHAADSPAPGPTPQTPTTTTTTGPALLLAAGIIGSAVAAAWYVRRERDRAGR